MGIKVESEEVKETTNVFWNYDPNDQSLDMFERKQMKLADKMRRRKKMKAFFQGMVRR